MVDDLDRILLGEEPLVPSAGFAQRVMETVWQRSDYLAPIRFPWWRFAAGLGMGLLCAVGSAAIVLRGDFSNLALSDMNGAIRAAGWIGRPEVLAAAVILVGTLLAVRLSVEFTSD